MATNSVTGTSIPMNSHLPWLNRRPAKPVTVERVCKIVKLYPMILILQGSQNFRLRADSLDTVEIVMGLEEISGNEEIIKKESFA
ncbi:hypothetical protein L6164_010550 [Bauhinia variegata]|uniref:Uncharacterized protein n=1 Tax=Bauhinia variegata TaxID=167791 RepID=A0ACB9PNI1_BAUVA|nr:hypothetical protein L6164_010550 [Bauhinia variegata]